jgi:hypothetical protein
MKRLLIALGHLFFVTVAFAQTDTIKPPYEKFPSYPPVKLLLPDSVSLYSRADLPKKMPVMVMVFNPQCEHCQQATEAMVAQIDKFKEIQIVMATTAPFGDMLAFRKKYRLDQFKNIVVSQDPNFFLNSFYMLETLPFYAFYNKNKELISAGESSMTVEKILAKFKPK